MVFSADLTGDLDIEVSQRSGQYGTARCVVAES